MNTNHNHPEDDLPNRLLAASTLITYRQRTRTRTLRRLALIILILAGILITYRFAAAAPPRPTDKPWPPRPPATYYCHRAAPHPPSYCFPRSRPPYHP